VGRKRAERQIVIEASPRQCFDALVDYETFPEWQRAVRACEVLTRDREGRGKEVAFEVDAKVRPVSYTLDYSYEEPHLISWRYVEGDVRDVDGEFVFEDLGDGTTLATYALRLDPGLPLPGRLITLLSEQVMQGSMEDLKHRVEGRV
jgi:ribosome-associated toxin RatA of RatAB toxin-antitoxin module